MDVTSTSTTKTFFMYNLCKNQCDITIFTDKSKTFMHVYYLTGCKIIIKRFLDRYKENEELKKKYLKCPYFCMASR